MGIRNRINLQLSKEGYKREKGRKARGAEIQNN